ncbi:MAG: PAS domain-containing protein [Nannocystaceae bacterium]
MIESDHTEPPEGPPRSALGRLIATAADLLCIIDRSGYLRWVNPAWERRLGWTATELKRGELITLVHPADADETLAALELLRDEERDARFDNRMRCRDGSYRWLQWSAVPMRHGAIYGTARDVTEQKLAERDAEERTRLLVMAEEVGGVGHWRIDLTRDSLTWSREMYRIHGVAPETYTPSVERAVEAYHPEDRGLVSDHIRDAILLRKEFEFELRLLRPDGTVRTVFSRGKCELSEEGRPLAVFGVFQDVTDRKRLQDRVTQSERMATVGTLAAGVAHEINNPLTWVIANLDAVDRGLDRLPRVGSMRAAELEELSTMIAEAQQGADQVRRIVRDLLTYSRAQPERLERVDVEEALDTAVNIATNQFKYRARLQRDYGGVPAVVADQSRLTQVFVNLIINAAQAIPERRKREGEIELSTRVDPDGRVRVVVSDNGLGIPEDVRGRIFDPFYTTKPVGVGTGLGLSISSNIIESFQGQIEVESAEGEGTRISVIVPACDGVTEPEPELDEHVHKARVLVIDREARLGRPLSRMLSTDYEVISLRSGRDALSVIDDGERVDAILCAVDIEDMSGLDFFRNVQRLAPGLGERVAFVTAGDYDDAHDLLERTGLPYIDEPIQPSELRELVERLAG